MIPIDDPVAIEKYLSLISDVVVPPNELSIDWVNRHHFIVMPMVSGSHFDDADTTRISQAMNAMGYKECLAVATEQLVDFPPVFRLATTPEELAVFSGECAHFNYVLVPEDNAFAILCTVFDYFLVAGPEKFVKDICGRDIVVARADYERYASSEDWPDSEKERLLAVAHKYG